MLSLKCKLKFGLKASAPHVRTSKIMQNEEFMKIMFDKTLIYDEPRHSDSQVSLFLWMHKIPPHAKPDSPVPRRDALPS